MELAIKNYIEENLPKLKGRVYPIFTTDIEDMSLVYTATPVSSGHINQSQMEFKIIGQDYDECKAVEKQLNGLLAMEDDASYVRTGEVSFFSQLSGGGVLFNDAVQMYEGTLFFTINWRYING